MRSIIALSILVFGCTSILADAPSAKSTTLTPAELQAFLGIKAWRVTIPAGFETVNYRYEWWVGGKRVVIGGVGGPSPEDGKVTVILQKDAAGYTLQTSGSDGDTGTTSVPRSSWPKEFISANQHSTNVGSGTKTDGSDLVLYRETFTKTDFHEMAKPNKKVQPDKEIGEFVIRVKFEKKK